MSSIRVCCRVRPQNKSEIAQGGLSVVEVPDAQTITIKGNESNHTFTFDRIFSDKCTQKEVYDDAAKPVIEDIMQGYNGTIFVYGQTSSGKTHTMQGPSIDDAELKGVIPRMINTVFDCITKADENIEFIVKASYIEIYMERIRDLLDPRKDNLKVREEKAKGVWVEGCTEVYIYREDDILEVMRSGSTNRAIAETKMNAESSRSHSIFILSIQQKNLKEGSVKNGKLYLVDLAGSEKIAKTGAQGLTLDEAKMINKSLSSLGNVINSLTDGKSQHIPYRDSKLTRVLQESLGGNSRTTLIINCSPSSYNENETLSTLRFGNRAKNIKNKAKINQERSAAELKILLLKAEKEIESLKEYIKELESVGGSVNNNNSNNTNNLSKSMDIIHGDDKGDQNILKEKCIQLEKLLFQKEEEKRELTEQLDSTTEQLQDKDQEIESLTHQIQENSKFHSLSHENDLLEAQVSELKIAVDKLKYESDEQRLTIEGLTLENVSFKNQLGEARAISGGITIEQGGSSVGRGGEDTTLISPSTTASSSGRSIEDASFSVNRHFDEWAEKEEQLKQLQRTPSKKPTSSSMTGAANNTVSPISPMTISSGVLSEVQIENDSLKQKIQDLELIIESLKLNNKEDNELKQDGNQNEMMDGIPEQQDDDEEMETGTKTPTLDEIPAEMILQAEQLRKLLNENSEQRGLLESLRSDNKKLTSRLNNIEDETRLRMEEELNLLREQTNQKLSEFGSLKESLLRDLENRCQKVIDLELVLDEYQDRVATLQERLKRSNKMNGDNESAMIQLKLDEMASAKHQLAIEISNLRKEKERMTKQLQSRNEHIFTLESTLKESQDRFYKLALNYESASLELKRYRDDAKGTETQGVARIVRPLRGGGGGAGVPGTGGSGGSGSLTSTTTHPSKLIMTPQKGSSNLYANTSKSSREYPSPMALSNNTSGQNSSGMVSPNATPNNNVGSGAVSPNQPGKLPSEGSSSSFFNIFRSKKNSTSTTSLPITSPSTSAATSPTQQSSNPSTTSVLTFPTTTNSVGSLSPIPISLSSSAYAPAVPTSPLNTSTPNTPSHSQPSSTNNSPPSTPSTSE